MAAIEVHAAKLPQENKLPVMKAAQAVAEAVNRLVNSKLSVPFIAINERAMAKIDAFLDPRMKSNKEAFTTSATDVVLALGEVLAALAPLTNVGGEVGEEFGEEFDESKMKLREIARYLEGFDGTLSEEQQAALDALDYYADEIDAFQNKLRSETQTEIVEEMMDFLTEIQGLIAALQRTLRTI